MFLLILQEEQLESSERMKQRVQQQLRTKVNIILLSSVLYQGVM